MNETAKDVNGARDATSAIRTLARKSGSDVQELMTLYALEGLLRRIAR